MKSLNFKLKIFSTIFILVLIIGTFSFSIIEKISLSDAFYFTIATISTVGYGDVYPTTEAGKILAIVIIVMGVGTFLGVVANAAEIILNIRERKHQLEKLNMIIGAFFSEVGTELITYLSNFDLEVDECRNELSIDGNCSKQSFNAIRNKLKKRRYIIEIDKSELPVLRKFLIQRRDFLLRLLENSSVLEHESFTKLLMAVFHLAEELEHRQKLSQLPDKDLEHLSNDIKRVYVLLVYQWLDYMEHLKKNYPYLFSLAIRTNPFNKMASPIIKK